MIRLKTSFVLLAMMGLAACGGGAPAPKSEPVNQAANIASQSTAPVQQAPAVIQEKDDPVATAPQAAIAPEPEPVNDDPLQFMELSSAEVSERVGRPHFVRRDGPAEVWQYRGEGCFLDLFLYKRGSGFHVKYVDLRSQQLGGDRLRDCLADIIRKRNHTKVTS